MNTLRRIAAVLLAGWAIAAPASAEAPVLKIAVQKAGTVAWELATIKSGGLDVANGFDLQIMEVAASPAAQVAFQGGEADAIVSDWIWVARQRAAGDDFVFIPYSRSVGGLMVPKGSLADSVDDLRGQKIGIAGGPLDKSWILLRAYAQQEYGFDLAAETEQVFGAPPLIAQIAETGEVAGATNFWHFLAKMEVAGMRELISIDEVAARLGLDPDVPLLGYVVRGDLLRDNPALVEGLRSASRQAKAKLASDSSAWDGIRPMMNATNEAEFEALKAGFLAGTPANGPIDEAAAAKVLALMATLGGEELVGAATTLPEGVFVQPGADASDLRDAGRFAPLVALTSIGGLVLLWSGLALLQSDARVLPGPWVVAPLFWRELLSGALLHHIGATLLRVALSFLLAMAIGLGLGLAMGRHRRLDRWLDPWLIVFLNLPALVVIVLAYLWIGLNETAAVLAVAANKIPTVVVTVREGARALDPRLDDMAAVFRMDRVTRLRHVVLPQLAPYIAAAGRSGVALIWKIVLVVEFLGRSDGVGFQIHLYFGLFDVAMILVYALSFVAVMLVIEALVFRPWERSATRWRRA